MDILVFGTKFATGYPDPDNGVTVSVTPIHEAFAKTYTSDAHFVGYMTPVCRRVKTDAIGHVAIEMNLLVADVDAPGHAVTDPWRASERVKIAALVAKHPGAFVYETRGGYRVVFRLPEPFPIKTSDDKQKWWSHYGAYRSYLARAFLISCDPACKDFTRFYRLPLVKRDGKTETFPTYGDADVPEALTLTTSPARARTPSYVKKALESAVADVRTAPVGERNNALNKAAFSIGGFIPKHLDRDTAFDALLHAILQNGGDEEIDAKKINDAIDAGMARPRELPDAPSGGAPAAPMPPSSEPDSAEPLDAETANFTDVANAERFVELHKDAVRFVTTWGRWMFWDGQRWVVDSDERALALAIESSKIMLSEAKKKITEAADQLADAVRSGDETEKVRAESKRKWATKYLDWAIKSQGRPRLEAMVALACTSVLISVSHAQLDSKPWLLNVENGTIDLATGTIRSHLREDLLTKLAPVKHDPTATAPTWDKFLNDAMSGDANVIAYLARLIGYSLTGEIRDHVLVFFYGPKGANGKSTFLKTIHKMLGDYSAPAARHLLFHGRSQRHPTEIADLHGLRFVTCSEIEEDMTFDESLVKDLTGGDLLKARRMRENFWQFMATHKLFIAGNYRPRVKGNDGGIWRRIRLVPWFVSFEGKEDTGMPDKLAREMSGILNWAIAGCLAWQRSGLGEPIAVKSATAEYREESNQLSEFVRVNCVIAPDAKVSRRALREAYDRHCRENGEAKPLDARHFAGKVRALGVTDTTVRESWIGKDGATYVNQPTDAWKGIRLLSKEEWESRWKRDAAEKEMSESSAHVTQVRGISTVPHAAPT